MNLGPASLPLSSLRGAIGEGSLQKNKKRSQKNTPSEIETKNKRMGKGMAPGKVGVICGGLLKAQKQSHRHSLIKLSVASKIKCHF